MTADSPMTTEIITDQQYASAALQSAAEAINQTLDLIVSHEDAFHESTLEPRLLIGVEIAKAQETFGMTFQEAGKLGSKVKAALPHGGKSSLPPVAGLVEKEPNSLGFSTWLVKNISRLPRTTAQKYATAFRALGIPVEQATAAKIRARIKDIRHHAGKNSLPMPTLNGLYKQGRPSKEDARLALTNATFPGDDPRQKLRDAREFFTDWIEKGEKLVSGGYLDALDKPGLAKVREFNLWMRDRINARSK